LSALLPALSRNQAALGVDIEKDVVEPLLA
jgi:hypothetical protein